MTPPPELDLDRLVADVHAEAPSDQPLDRLATAAATALELAGLADRLVGHFVDEARAAGASWTDIGAEIGVTKQAAQQRHRDRGRRRQRDDGVAGRFRIATDDFRLALDRAVAAATERGHAAVGTEHLLLGVLAMPDTVGARALAALDVDADALAPLVARVDRAARRRRTNTRASEADVGPRFTPGAKKALHQAHRTARRERCRFLGTEHVVMALADGDGRAADFLADLGVTPERARDAVYQLWGRT